MNRRKLLRLRQVEEVTGLKKSYIYQLMKFNKFPTSVKLGTKAVAWRSDEVGQWIDSRPRIVNHEA